VGLFNELITAFDEAAERHGVERLKTSGYTYIAVCGVSEQRLDHSKRIVEFAREMLQILARFDRENGMNVTVRMALKRRAGYGRGDRPREVCL
jgi:class 3 adenylate cyclase